jgi:hypothetical protein
VAELVDALASGASGGNPVEVQVLFSAPHNRTLPDHEEQRKILFFMYFFYKYALTPNYSPEVLPSFWLLTQAA